MKTDLLLAADQAVSPEERRAFLDHFPKMQGAHVADILEMLDDNDAHLDVVEPMYEQHAHEVPEPGLLAIATHLCIGIRGDVTGVDWESVRELVERIRPRLALV